MKTLVPLINLYSSVQKLLLYQLHSTIIIKTQIQLSINLFNYSKLDLIQLTDQMCDQIESSFSPHLPPRPLYDTVRCRRMHARFSILRQMVLVGGSTSSTSKNNSNRPNRKLLIILKLIKTISSKPRRHFT